jgi:hypothetical protein
MLLPKISVTALVAVACITFPSFSLAQPGDAHAPLWRSTPQIKKAAAELVQCRRRQTYVTRVHCSQKITREILPALVRQSRRSKKTHDFVSPKIRRLINGHSPTRRALINHGALIRLAEAPPSSWLPPAAVARIQSSLHPKAGATSPITPFAASIPSTGQSFYVTYQDLTDPNCTQIDADAKAAVALPNTMVILQIGAPSGSADISPYGTTTDMSIQTAIGDLADCYLPAWFNAAPAKDTGYVSVTTTSDGADTSGSDQATNGAAFYNNMYLEWASVVELYEYYVGDAFAGIMNYQAAGDDVEPGYKETDTLALDWLGGFNSEEELAAAGEDSAYGYELTPLYDDGVNLETCASASCFDTPDDLHWTSDDQWEVFWGLTYDYGLPEVYDTGWPQYYADLDTAAKAANPTGDKSAGGPVPTWSGVLFECTVPSVNPGISISSAQSAYTQFDEGSSGVTGTGQAPKWLTEIHPLGYESEKCEN